MVDYAVEPLVWPPSQVGRKFKTRQGTVSPRHVFLSAGIDDWAFIIYQLWHCGFIQGDNNVYT